MTTEEARKVICKKLHEVFNDFPCICGENKLATNLNRLDEEKLAEVLVCLDLLKEIEPVQSGFNYVLESINLDEWSK